jgi:predicted MFS family arabinose efflux permease
MAAAGLVVAVLSRRINRRHGIWISLALLSIPTTMLAVTDSIAVFTALRIAQGVFMATAFTLTMAYLAEQCSAEETAGALAAYITGNVASNLVGRLVSASIVDELGLAANFLVFAVLNLSGALLVFLGLRHATPMEGESVSLRRSLAAWGAHLRNGALRCSFGIGFVILFAFIGTFTYVNFVLAAPPLSLSPMSLGLVYFVFLPALLTTPFAGRSVARFGARASVQTALAVAIAGLPLLVAPRLSLVLAGLALVGVGTFFAQAVATGFVGRVAAIDRGAASGIYLASYYLGGLAGSAILGRIYDSLGWVACVAGIGCALAVAAGLASRLRESAAPGNERHPGR